MIHKSELSTIDSLRQSYRPSLRVESVSVCCNLHELVAHARPGQCAVPTPEKKFAYLLTRRAPSDRRPNIQEDANAAVLSYQRQMLSVKQNFLVRHKRTTLGVTVAYWDRTEAQTRQALHGHVLTWSKRRKISATEYVP